MKKTAAFRISLTFNILIFFMLLAAFVYVGPNKIERKIFSMKNPPSSNLQEEKKNLFYVYETLQSDVVFLGDSITAWVDWTGLLGFPVMNRGIEGDTTYQVIDRIDEVISRNPKKLFILLGVNNLNRERESAEEMLVSYKDLLDTLAERLPQTKIYVVSILPINNNMRFTDLQNSDIKIANTGLQKLTSSYGSHVYFIDIYDYFLGGGSLTRL